VVRAVSSPRAFAAEYVYLPLSTCARTPRLTFPRTMPVRARRGARTVDDRVATCLAPGKRGGRGGGAPPQRRAPSPGRSTCRERARVTCLCTSWPLCGSCGRARRGERGGTGGGGFCQALQVWARGQGSSRVRVWVQDSVLGFGFGFRIRFWGSGLGSGFGFGVRVPLRGRGCGRRGCGWRGARTRA